MVLVEDGVETYAIVMLVLASLMAFLQFKEPARKQIFVQARSVISMLFFTILLVVYVFMIDNILLRHMKPLSWLQGTMPTTQRITVIGAR